MTAVGNWFGKGKRGIIVKTRVNARLLFDVDVNNATTLLCHFFSFFLFAILGLIFGIWNSHTSVGNILGSLIAGHFVESNWGMSFIIPGAIIGFMGFIIFLFLVTDPRSVGCNPPDHHGSRDETVRRYPLCFYRLVSTLFSTF